MDLYSEKANQKINQFVQGGIEKLHIVADFDRTLTKGITGYRGATTWGILERFLKPEYQEVEKELYLHYRTLELQGTMTAEDAVHWWESTLENYIRADISFGDVQKEIRKELVPRDGVQELFSLTTDIRVPVIIISAGIKNIIDFWCSEYEFSPQLVLSTELIFDGESHIIGWKKESLVHVLNKNEQALPFTKSIQESRPNVVLIGDSFDDAAMANGDTNVLRILVDDLDADEKQLRNETYVGKLHDRFDIHLTTSIEPVVDILQKILTK
jgi:cytosolic 5'-nucleotidase 3